MATTDGDSGPTRVSPRWRLLGVASMAAFALDEQARVRYWSGEAQRLFGHAPSDVIGQRLSELLSIPADSQPVFEPKAGTRPWTGTCLVARPGEPSHEVAWWIYPLDGVFGLRLLVLGTDARQLRETGPGLAVDGVIIVPPAAGVDRLDEVRVLRASPVTVRPEPGDVDAMALRIAAALPLLHPEQRDRVVDQIIAWGVPAVQVSVATRLPFVPYAAGMPRVIRLRPGETAPAALAETADSGGPSRDVDDRLAFLTEAGARVTGAPDITAAAQELARVLVPRLADLATVYLREQVLSGGDRPHRAAELSAPLRRMAVAHRGPAWWDELTPLGQLVSLPRDTPLARSVAAGEPVVVPWLSSDLTGFVFGGSGDPRLASLVERYSLLVVPISVHDAVLGNVVLLRGTGRSAFDQLDLRLTGDLARRAAVTIDNARLQGRERHTAAELRRLLLPDKLPTVPGVQVRHLQCPAPQATKVGGDWFDVIPLPRRRVALVVGDVMGHGPGSAAVMGQFRMAVRALGTQDLPPADLLGRLDLLAAGLGETHLGSCLYAVYDPVTRTCEVANAGHLPPLLVHPDGGCTLVDVPPGAPVGVGDVAFDHAVFPVDDGSRLVLCGDGLMAADDQDDEDAMAALCAELSGAFSSFDAVCEEVLRWLHRRDPAADVAVLAAELTGLSMPTAPEDLTPFRRA